MIVMLVLLFLLVVVAVILMESRMGRLRWLLAETAERTAKLEGKIGDLQHQVALLPIHLAGHTRLFKVIQ